MSDLEYLSQEIVEQLPIEIFTENAYLEYSMYVILDRALPHIGDGLKPVQRRIIYAMSELGLKATSRHKKSARTVGDVLGKFHPHGDSACYEAMVLMAQPFSYRYPFIDGQGNWGAPDDPKSFAAMRYTESRLSHYAEIMLEELGQGTVEWIDNFDGTLKEPFILPSRLPNILLNGTTGIAVGMATDIPPHNLNEVVNACIYLLDHPESNLDDIYKFIKGPDYPTNAEIITSEKHIKNIYENGNGSIRMRAVFHRKNDDIVITALPYQVSGAKVLEQIAAQMTAKKLPMIMNLRDESDHEEPTRFIITPKFNRIDIESLMAHLFATTDLERTYRVNMNVIGLNGRPQVKNLLLMLKEWLEFRVQTVKKRLQYRLNKILARLHILDGFLSAYLNIDKVIKLIREKDDPKKELMRKFKFSAIQTYAILDMKLRLLAKLEEIKIKEEQEALKEERELLKKTLKSKTLLKTLIRKELKEDTKKYGDNRKSSIVQRKSAHALAKTDIIPAEPVTVILSKNGWIKSAKGHDIDVEKLNFKSGDQLMKIAKGKNNQNVVLMDTTGKSYSLIAHSLPSARSQGAPLTGRLTLPADATFTALLLNQPEDKFLIASDAGYGFIVKYRDLFTKNKNGKVILSLPFRSSPLPPVWIKDCDNDLLVALSSEGRLLIYPIKELPVLSKGKGNKIIDIPSIRVKTRQELLKNLTVITIKHLIIFYSGKRTLTLKPGNWAEYQGNRGRRGKKLPRGYQNVDYIEIVTVKKPKNFE